MHITDNLSNTVLQIFSVSVSVTLFKKPLTPPLVLNTTEQILFDGFLKKRVNVCRDKIMRKSVETMTNSP